MTKYVKLEDNELIFPPVNIEKNGCLICNYNYEGNYEMLLEDGWKPLIEAEKPEDEYTLSYEEDEHEIREIIHIVTEEEKEERERLRILGLKCTKRVFALILTQIGISYDRLKALIAEEPMAQLEWDLCVELERKNPLLDIMALRLGVTPAVVDAIFRYANGEITVEELMEIYHHEVPEPIEEVESISEQPELEEGNE